MSVEPPAILFAAPGRVPYPGGCVTEPAFFALDYLIRYRADVTVGGVLYPDAEVLPLLRGVLAEPAKYGVTPQAALAARQRFLTQAGQALSAEGGQVAWLEKEFRA